MKISKLFNIHYGNALSLNAIKKTKSGINFVSRTSKNNGVSAIVEELPQTKPFESGLITVAVGGSVLESFVQIKPFYTGYHMMILEPKEKMTLNNKLFYCFCIKRNKYKYSYGRQANATLKNLEMPDQIPLWVNKFDMTNLENIAKSISNKTINLTDRSWKWFSYLEIFDIERGYYNKRPTKVGNVNFVSASSHNNGVTDKIEKKSIEKIYPGNCITVANNGQYTTCAFYQKNDFTCSHDVNILRIKNTKMTPHIAMFLSPLIRREKYRFNYGRKWRYQRMLKTKIKIPVDQNNNPDWKFMKQYISTLSYSSNLV